GQPDRRDQRRGHDADAHAHPDSHANADTNPDAVADAYTHADPDTHADADTVADANLHAFAHAQPVPHALAEPDAHVRRAGTHTHADTVAYPNSDANPHPNPDTPPHADANAEPDAHVRRAGTDPHADTVADRRAFAGTHADPNLAAVDGDTHGARGKRLRPHHAHGPGWRRRRHLPVARRRRPDPRGAGLNAGCPSDGGQRGNLLRGCDKRRRRKHDDDGEAGRLHRRMAHQPLGPRLRADRG